MPTGIDWRFNELSSAVKRIIYEVFGVNQPTQTRFTHVTRFISHFIDTVTPELLTHDLICAAVGIHDQLGNTTKYHFQASFTLTAIVTHELVTPLRLNENVGGRTSETLAVVAKFNEFTLVLRFPELSSAVKNNTYDVLGVNPVTENVLTHATRLRFHFMFTVVHVLSVHAFTWAEVGTQDQLSKTTKYHFHASFTLTEKFAHEPEIELEIRDDTTGGVISQIFSNSWSRVCKINFISSRIAIFLALTSDAIWDQFILAISLSIRSMTLRTKSSLLLILSNARLILSSSCALRIQVLHLQELSAEPLHLSSLPLLKRSSEPLHLHELSSSRQPPLSAKTVRNGAVIRIIQIILAFLEIFIKFVVRL